MVSTFQKLLDSLLLADKKKGSLIRTEKFPYSKIILVPCQYKYILLYQLQITLC